MAHMVKNLPAAQETRVLSLGWDDPLEKEWLPSLVFLPEDVHGQMSLLAVYGVTKRQTRLSG